MKVKYGKVFEKRLNKHYDELKWLYVELFHDENAFDYFCSMLVKYYNDRSVLLKKMDRKREKNPSIA